MLQALQYIGDKVGSTDPEAFPEVDQAIREAFVKLDEDLFAKAAEALEGPRFLNEAIAALQPAFAGSCAVVSFYNCDSQILRVANVGDSRAVLGRGSASGKYEAIELSTDQTGNNTSEVARIHREHPDEPEIIKDGRVLGLAVTRAFGDSRWKWPREVQEAAQKRFFGPRVREGLKTPPYITAEPEIKTMKINPDRRDFLIIASDGLWDNITSEQAVELVSKWLKTHDATREAQRPNLANPPSQPLSVDPDAPLRENPAGVRPYPSLYQAQSKDFVVKDENAATHLARNALGGADEDRLCGLLTATSPFSREMR